MIRLLACIFLLSGLAACAGGAPYPDRLNCSAGGEICVELSADEPIDFGEPVVVTITVTSEKDFPELGIHLATDPYGYAMIQDAEKDELGQVVTKEPSKVYWLVEIKENQPVTFTRKIYIPPDDGGLWY
jgi:hypothetical protein